jgi:hypothetical protein
MSYGEAVEDALWSSLSTQRILGLMQDLINRLSYTCRIEFWAQIYPSLTAIDCDTFHTK